MSEIKDHWQKRRIGKPNMKLQLVAKDKRVFVENIDLKAKTVKDSMTVVKAGMCIQVVVE